MVLMLRHELVNLTWIRLAKTPLSFGVMIEKEVNLRELFVRYQTSAEISKLK